MKRLTNDLPEFSLIREFHENKDIGIGQIGQFRRHFHNHGHDIILHILKLRQETQQGLRLRAVTHCPSIFVKFQSLLGLSDQEISRMRRWNIFKG